MTTKPRRTWSSPPDCRCGVCRSFTMNPVRDYGGVMSVRLCGNCESDFKRALKPAVMAVEREVSMRIETMRCA